MRRPRMALVALVALVSTACSAGGAGDAGSFADRLALLPASVADGSGDLVVTMADLDRAAELAGVRRPPDAGDAVAVADYVRVVTGLTGLDPARPGVVAALVPDTVHVESTARVGEFADELGWSIADVSWFVEARVQPNTFMVAGGDFDEARLTSAMGERDGDVWRVGGEDGEIGIGHSPARPFGESLRTALVDGNLVVGRSTPPVAAAVASDGPTLADDEVLRSLATAMNDAGAYSVLLTAAGSYPVDAATGGATPSALDRMRDQVLPEPFRGVAGGLTSQDGAPIVLLAYVHDTPEAARANADALRGLVERGHGRQSRVPWSEVLRVDGIRTDGGVLVARLGLAGKGYPQLAYQLLSTRDLLVLHR
jgi:hypothetical protein